MPQQRHQQAAGRSGLGVAAGTEGGLGAGETPRLPSKLGARQAGQKGNEAAWRRGFSSLRIATDLRPSPLSPAPPNVSRTGNLPAPPLLVSLLQEPRPTPRPLVCLL